MIYVHLQPQVWPIRYPQDVQRLRGIFNAKGFDTSNAEIQEAWERYSESMAAGWLILPESDEDCWDAIKVYFGLNV